MSKLVSRVCKRGSSHNNAVNGSKEMGEKASGGDNPIVVMGDFAVGDNSMDAGGRVRLEGAVETLVPISEDGLELDKYEDEENRMFDSDEVDAYPHLKDWELKFMRLSKETGRLDLLGEGMACGVVNAG